MATVSSSLRVTDTQFAKAKAELADFVSIPSVSNPSSSDYSVDHLDRAARFAGDRLSQLNFNVRYERVKDSPQFVVAERVHDAALPTILLYGHYDVQPVEREKWNTDPFQVVEKNGRLYGRGASDDKAGVMAILTALRVYNEAGRKTLVNVKVLLEGEEEFGSNSITKLVEKEREALNADALIVLDGGNKDVNTGTLENSTRGVLTMALKVHALAQPTHSGVGCLAPDPAQALAGLIHSLRDPRAIPGFMDECKTLGEEEVALLDSSSVSAEAYAKESGVVEGGLLRGDPSHSIFRKITEEPSLSIINMNCGLPGGGNSIQDVAECTIGVRTTAGQTPDHIERVLREHFDRESIMWNLPYTFERAGLSACAWKADLSKPFATAYLEAMGTCYDSTAVMPTGGAIPFLADFQKTFPKMEMFIVGVEDPDTNEHSHNESQHIGVFRNAIDSLITFLERAEQVQPAKE